MSNYSTHNPYSTISEKNLSDYIKLRIALIRKNPGWGLNKYPNPTKWVNDIINNMNVDDFPNCKKKGIIINNTYLRSLPSCTPHFTNWSSEGEGYPFDNLQISYLHAFQPIYILHTTKNKDWHLIFTTQCVVGWVNSRDTAFVDQNFINNWEKNKFVTPTEDNIPIFNKDSDVYMANSRIGQILPLQKEDKNHFEVLTASLRSNGYAKLQIGKILKVKSEIAPMTLTVNNLARIANSLIDKPYGWGGLCGYRDCSGMLRDLYGAFGLFLPRNSKWQSKSGNIINLEKMRVKDKIKLISEKGIPFLTLLYFPGHIMLYIGQKDGVPYVFHTIWGFKTRRAFRDPGRAILGKSLIMPLTFGKKYCQLKSFPIKRITAMTLLNDNLITPEVFETQMLENINQEDILEGEKENRVKLHPDLIKNKAIIKLARPYCDYINAITLINKKIIFKMHNNKEIIWDDGKKHKTLTEKIEDPDLKDIFYQKYHQTYPLNIPTKDEDPGRIRNQDFLKIKT